MTKKEKCLEILDKIGYYNTEQDKLKTRWE